MHSQSCYICKYTYLDVVTGYTTNWTLNFVLLFVILYYIGWMSIYYKLRCDI